MIIQPLGQGVALDVQGNNLDEAIYVYCVDRRTTNGETSYIQIKDAEGGNVRSIAINNDTDGIIIRKAKTDTIYSTNSMSPESNTTNSVFFTKIVNPNFHSKEIFS